ncbi:hypothetical protein AGMMS49938_02950 [Fibrobacterales bacterium]|nr:hypothetical protein AGMMS49938_02950 [Fibrobacterales bacterium]
MKKVLAVAVFACAVSAFAGWDKFPVIEDGKGQAKIAFSDSRQGNDPGKDIDFGIRYAPLANLELQSWWGGEGGNYLLGARYQIIPVLSAGVDVGFPFPGTAWSFTPNVQFSTSITDKLSLGTNVDVTIYTEDAAKKTNGLDLSAGLELDFAFSEKSLFWVSFDIGTGLTDTDDNGTKIKPKDDERGLGFSPAVGYSVTVGNLNFGTNVGFAFGKDAGNDPVNTTVGLDASVTF